MEYRLTNKRKIRSIAIFALPVILFMLFMSVKSEQADAATTGVVTAQSLFVRKGPGTTYDIVKINGVQVSLSKGDYVAVYYEEEGWYAVTAGFNGSRVEGFVSKKYVDVSVAVPTGKPTNTPAPTRAIDASTGLPEGTTLSVMTYGFPLKGFVIATKLNVRSGAGTGYSIIDSLIQNDSVTVTDCKKSGGSYWYQVEYYSDVLKKNITAYASASYIAVEIKALPTQTPTPTPRDMTPKLVTSGFPYDGYVVADALNVRSGAGTGYKRAAILLEGDKVRVVAAKKDTDGKYWYEISYVKDNKTQTGYVSNRYLFVDVPVPTATPKPTNSPTPTPDTRVAVLVTGGFPYVGQVLTDNLNVRKGAGTTFDKIGIQLMKGDLVTVGSAVKAADNQYWYAVSFNLGGKNYSGYTLSSYVYVIIPTATPTPTNTPSPTPTKRPSATPVPETFPSPVLAYASSGYPSGEAWGAVSGYGRLNNSASISQVFYAQPKTGTYVKDNNGSTIYLTKDMTFTLYDSYYGLDGIRYRQIMLLYKGRYYYGFLPEKYITELTGSALAQYRLSPTPAPDMANMDDFLFYLYLEDQGFPDSYTEILEKLHEKHPSWVFTAYHTGLYWDEVIEKESKAGINLIPNSYNPSLLSTVEGAYNWKTEVYTVYDSPYWVTASEGAIEYYMDPRNWLDDKSIFMFESLKYNSGYQLLSEVENLLYGTPFYNKTFTYTDDYGKKKTISYAQAFIDAAEYSGVSPYHLVTRVRQEVVTGTNSVSNSVSGTVSGYYNLYNFYNIGAYHSTAAGGAIVNGLKYAQNGVANNDEYNDLCLIPWNNPYRAIVGGAYIIAQQYIERGQDTIYLQKFNVTETSTFAHQYMANVMAPASEGKRLADAYVNADDYPIVFIIPVYDGMPDECCKKPADSGCPNNWLKSLSVKTTDGATLSFNVTFDCAKEQDYYITTSRNNNMLQIIATSVCKNAKVGGNGVVVAEASGECFKVNVTAENGDIRTYKIYVRFSD